MSDLYTDTSIDWSDRDREIWHRSRYHSVQVLALHFGLTEKEIREILAEQVRKIGAA